MSDEELQAIKRRLDAEPGDEGLAREYERALLRSGRTGEVARLYEERLRCDSRWSELEADPRSPRVRYCTNCRRSVTLVRDVPELKRYVAAGLQVAGTPELLTTLAGNVVGSLSQGQPSPPLPECFAVGAAEDFPPDAEANQWPSCACLRGEPRDTRFHEEVQDTECDAWKRLVELVEIAARDNRREFSPRADMDADSWAQIITLPPNIAKLKEVRVLKLYGSHLVRIPPEIGEMTTLSQFEPYTSYRLHWFPYEITRCKNLSQSCVSTRALYGNYKYRPRFPDLEIEQGPVSGRCSVCDKAADSFRQVWTSMRVATDVLPLLVNACSGACIKRLPPPAEGYVPRPHRGGRTNRTPGPNH